MAKDNQATSSTPAIVTRSTSTAGPSLPPAVAKLYELENWVGSHRQHFGRFGIVDLTTLTVAKAEGLVGRGFQRIKKK